MFSSLAGFLLKHGIPGGQRLWSVASRLDPDACLHVTNRYGARLAIDPQDYIDAFVLRAGFYESEVFDEIRAAMTESDVFWDIGGNAGHHAISLSHLLPQAQIVCFEPSASEVYRIHRSMRLSRTHFEVLPIALSDDDHVARFYLCGGNRGRNSLDAWGDPSQYEATIAPCMRGDALCADHGYKVPKVIKIDVEGAELRVLKGLEKVLSSPTCRRVVFEAGVEVMDEADPIHKLLAGHGFAKPRQLKRNEKTEHDLENFVADKL